MSENQQRPRKNTNLREKPLLLGFAVQKERFDGGIQISIRWGRILAVLLLLSVTGWIGTTSALYAYLKYKQGFEAVSFTNTLFLQRSELRRKMGDQHIRESIVEIEAGNYSDAFRLLHFGVARSPGNLEGRKIIAEFYELAKKRPAIAADYLIGGLEHGGIQDIDYVKQLLRVLLRNQMDEKIQQIVDEHLPEEPVLTNINRILALGATNANYLRGNYDQAEDYLMNYNLMELIEGLLISSKISWDRGNHTTAVTKLEHMLNRFPNSDPILSQISSYYLEIGDIDKARRFTILRSIKDPLNYKPRLALLHIHNQAGDTEREKSEIERIFDQFGNDNLALEEFANFAAKIGNVDLAKRIQAVAIKNEFDVAIFTLLVIEAYIVNKDYAEAFNLTENLIEEQSDWLTERWATFNSLRSLTAFGISRPDLGEIYLQNFLKDTVQRPQSYLNVATHFLTINRIPQARKALTVAHQQFPKNQKILSELIDVELELGNTEKLSQLLVQILKMRRPQLELLAKAYNELGSDRFIFTQNRDILLLQLGAILRENNQNRSPMETPL